MKFGLFAKKKGMTQIFDEKGNVIPVTLLEAGPCVVVEKRTKAKHGYEAIQVGYEMKSEKKMNKPERGYFAKKKLDCFKHLKEFRVSPVDDFDIGQVMTAAAFQVGDFVDVEGVTKGRGFQGVIKRHGKAGGPDSHGSDFHRRTGSIGMRTWPGRVLKNMRLPGHYGDVQVTTRHLKVVGVKPEQNLLLVEGAVPGSTNGLVVIYSRKEDFPKRFKVDAPKAETPAA